MVNTYVRQLISRDPQCLIDTRVPKLRERAKEYTLAANHIFKEMRLGDAARECTFDAMFGIGVMKVGLKPNEIGNAESWEYDTGKPFAEPVGLDDWVHDMTAKRMDQCRYFGNRYRLPLSLLKESGLFDSKQTERMSATLQDLYNETGDVRASSLTKRESYYSDGEYEPHVELYDIWLPFEGKILTIPADMYGMSYRDPIREIDWSGPEEGPYHILSYSDVPDNTMPLAPAANLYDLHVFLNTIYRKLRNQAERQKEILGYAGEADQDARRVVDAGDGESIRLDAPDKLNNVRFGGIDSNLLAMFLNGKDQFSYFAGNLDVLSGLGAQSDTLGQDRLIAQSASQRLSEMQGRTAKFLTRTMKSVAWYIHDDPSLSVSVEKPITSRRTRTIVYDASRREGDYLDYNYDLVAHSTTDMTPAMRAEQMMAIHDRIILPNQATMQQSGQSFDVVGFVKKVSGYAMVDEMGEFLNSGEAPLPDGDEREIDAANKPLETKRTYERINRPSGTRRGAEKALTQTLLGASGNPDEMDSIGREGL